ncbi:cell division protein CrgA [Actinomycetaceae bacterium TAE3-ERU4]|nr:cell division protein CrgA [Actinomycetaceae bacterium TAE3-ERU4]
MPKSRKRKINGKPVSRAPERSTDLPEDPNAHIKMSPAWWAPVFVSLALIGLVWLVVYYLTGAQYPIPGILHWNMAIALGFMMSGFIMVLYWR